VIQVRLAASWPVTSTTAAAVPATIRSPSPALRHKMKASGRR
jgi:hypothetical protein